MLHLRCSKVSNTGLEQLGVNLKGLTSLLKIDVDFSSYPLPSELSDENFEALEKVLKSMKTKPVVSIRR